MKKLFFLLASSLLLVSCGGNNSGTSSDSAGGNSSASQDGNTLTGKEVYVNNCRVCHGDDGKAGVGGAKDLSKSAMSPEVAKEIITNGKGMMSAFKGRISETDISNVVAYIQSLRK